MEVSKYVSSLIPVVVRGNYLLLLGLLAATTNACRVSPWLRRSSTLSDMRLVRVVRGP